MKESASVKILISYHKKDTLFKDAVLTPIHVGSAVYDGDEAEWFSENMISDDTGNNISSKNPIFNEMTAVYWAWKNYEKLDDPEYIGFQHYRRHFIFEEKKKGTFECNHYSEDYLTEKLNYSQDSLDYYLKKADFIVSKPMYFKSVIDQYSNTLEKSDLIDAIEILKKLKPEYSVFCDEYVNGTASFFYNMFIMPKNMFFEYCEFIFPILFEFERTHDMTNKRMYISERLTGVFIYAQMQKKKKCQYLPVMYLEEQTVIPIVMATDDNYIIPTATAISSILINSKKTTFCEFHLLLPKELKGKAEEVLKPSLSRFMNYSLEFHYMENCSFELKISHITVATYYRLYLTGILKNCSKCLYLDSDIIVLDDLANLFRTNISEKYVAGVEAAGYYYPESWKKKHSDEIGIPIDNYVNAGVLLMNLDLMRKDGIDKQMLSLANRGFSSQDQDVINVACYGKIRVLDFENNVMIKYLSESNGKVSVNIEPARVYGLSDRNMKKLPHIIHFADKTKPWDSDCIYSSIWEQYHKRYEHIGMDPKISVIVPVYNKREYLQECLDSILNQTLKDIEIILINDGSTDGSLEMMKEYAAKDNRILLIDQENQGVGMTRNIGIRNCASKYLCFIDPDDYYPSDDVLESLYKAAETSGLPIAGGSWSEYDGKDVKTEFTGKYENYSFSKNSPVNFRDYQFDYGFHRFIYSSEFIRENEIEFPSYSRFQDPPFLLKALSKAGTFYGITKIAYCYRRCHKSIEWTYEKCCDLVCGITDNLRVSSELGLAKVHRLNTDRINHEYADRLVNAVSASKQDRRLLKLLIRANTAVDRKLLKTVIPSMNDSFCLRPLNECIDRITPQPIMSFRRRVKHKLRKILKIFR